MLDRQSLSPVVEGEVGSASRQCWCQQCPCKLSDKHFESVCSARLACAALQGILGVLVQDSVHGPPGWHPPGWRPD